MDNGVGVGGGEPDLRGRDVEQAQRGVERVAAGGADSAVGRVEHRAADIGGGGEHGVRPLGGSVAARVSGDDDGRGHADRPGGVHHGPQAGLDAVDLVVGGDADGERSDGSPHRASTSRTNSGSRTWVPAVHPGIDRSMSCTSSPVHVWASTSGR